MRPAHLFCIFAALLVVQGNLYAKPPVATIVDFSSKTKDSEKDPLEELSKYNGKTIRNIQIIVRDVFENPSNWLFRTVNDLKASTRESTVRQELFFKEGDVFDAFSIRESIRILRILRYLRRFQVKVSEVGADEVDVEFSVQDTWTFIPQFSFSSGDGRDKIAAGIAESNLLGYGKRGEILYEEDEGRESISGVYDDWRVMGGDYTMLAGYFDRNDGEASIFSFGRPFRSLLDRDSWGFTSNTSDTVGRLFQNGDERYIFRQEKNDFNFRYTFSTGDPQVRRRRFSFGYFYSERQFFQADLDDYDALNLDPELVSNDPALLADNRRFSGPTFHYSSITPDFITLDHIDRFDRVAEYNLGSAKSIFLHYAPDFLGSKENALNIGGSHSRGVQFDRGSFLRGELSGSARVTEDGVEDSILHAELKYYDLLGEIKLGDWSLGTHTFASSFFIDYGNDLDPDREFLIGADNAIRGYEARTFPGDKRYALNIEQRFHLFDNILQLLSVGGALFFDVGGATNDNIGDLFTDHSYSDVGAGLRFGFPRSSGGKVFRVDVALPLRDGPDGSDRFEPRLILSGGQLFDAYLRSEILGQERASLDLGFDD